MKLLSTEEQFLKSHDLTIKDFQALCVKFKNNNLLVQRFSVLTVVNCLAQWCIFNRLVTLILFILFGCQEGQQQFSNKFKAQMQEEIIQEEHEREYREIQDKLWYQLTEAGYLEIYWKDTKVESRFYGFTMPEPEPFRIIYDVDSSYIEVDTIWLEWK